MKGRFSQVTDVAPAAGSSFTAEQIAQKMKDNPKWDKQDAIASLERDAELTRKRAEAEKTNASRTGKGTRVFVGLTRGKNPKVISWEAFDTDKPETLPETIVDFHKTIGADTTETQMVRYLADGYNDAQYRAASDVLAEYVEPNWPDDVAKQFKTVISNYVAGTGVSIDDAVELLKPGFAKAFEARMAAAKA